MNNKISIKITDKIKKEILDKFVYENPNTSIFQTPEIAEVYERTNGCTPLTLVAINEDTDEIVASLLAKILEEKRGFLSSFSVHTTIRGGPVFLDNEEGIKAVSLLLEYYNKIIAKNVLYSRIYPLNDTPQIIPSFKENGYIYEDWQNYLLNLNKPIDEIWKQLKKYRRQGINRAKRRGVIIEEINDKEAIPVFYSLLQETFKARRNPLEDIDNFEATFDLLVPPKMAKFLMAKHEGRYIAAMLILLYKGVAYEWYVGSSKKREDLSLYPNDLMVWHAIELSKNNGFHTFDFGGGGKPNEATAGWVRFKKEFGSDFVNYGRYTKIHSPLKLKIAEKGFGIYRKMFIK